MATEEESTKRGPMLSMSKSGMEEEESTGKRLPEYSTREEEAIGEGFLVVGVEENEVIEEEIQPVEEAVGSNGIEELQRGTPLLRYTRRSGVPHFKYVQLASDNTYFRWFSKKKTAEQSTIQISNITEIIRGQHTEVFRRSQQPQLEVASFSVIYNDGENTFDVVAKGQDECTLWFETLTALVEKYRENESEDDLRNFDTFNCSLLHVDRYRCGNRNLLRGIVGNEPLKKYVIKALLSELKKADSKYEKLRKIFAKQTIQSHRDCGTLEDQINELDERRQKAREFLNESTNDKVSRSDVWRLNVDLDSLLEKCEVCAKEAKKG